MSSTVSARVGRHRQRYENEFRLVAGCIPYRLKPVAQADNVDFYVKKEDGKVDLIYRLEVLMISSPNRHDLVFPKGGWENDESMCEAACREALEEAGVRGILNEETKLGEWVFRSKSREESGSTGGACKGHMFALEVKEELERWPEQSCHKRRWVTVMDALRLCRYPWMREALAACIKLLSKNLGLPCTELSKILSYYSVNERKIDVPEPSSYYIARELGIDVCFVKSTVPERAAINAFC